MVDAADSKSVGGDSVGVRVPPEVFFIWHNSQNTMPKHNGKEDGNGYSTMNHHDESVSSPLPLHSQFHPQFYPQLDGLRCLAVALVVFFHAGYIGFGWIGVQIFFVLSGFLITRILLEQKQNATMLGGFLLPFLGRRALRIFPLYFAYLGILCLVHVSTSQNLPYFSDAFSRSWPALFTYTYNWTRLSPDWLGSPYFTHFWSLCVEEHFYLVWPLLVYGLSLRWLKVVTLGLLLISPVVRAWLGIRFHAYSSQWNAIGDAVYWNSFSHLDAFATGGAISLFSLQHLRHIGLFLLFALALFLGLGCFFLWPDYLRLFPKHLGYPFPLFFFAQHIWGYSLLNLITAFFLVYLLQHKPGTSIFCARPVVALGKISYGVYVFHQGLLYLYKTICPFSAWTWSGALHFLFYLVLLVLLSSLSFYVWERRFLQMKDKFWPKGRRAMECADGAKSCKN